MYKRQVQGSVGINKAVTWSLPGYSGTLSSIDQNGVLTIGAAETETTLTVRAASVYDNTKYAVWTFNVKQTEDETEDNSVDGAAHIIPRDKLDDSSDWMAIAQTGGYYLIVRVNALRNDIPSSPYMSSGDYDYATSNIKSKIETWYNGTTTGTLAGLKSFAVRSDADVTVGQYGNVTAPISKPNATTGYEYPFVLSFQESALFMATQWDSGDSDLTPVSSQYADSNWTTRMQNGGDISVNWLRSPGSTASRASYVTAFGDVIDEEVSARSGAVRPAIWVRAEIFD